MAEGGGGGGVAAGSPPCGACKFLRRRCVADCVFAPYFSSDHGAARFAAVHKVFGASNAAKLLAHLPAADRCEAVVTVTYEAQARLRDPVYGCVAQVFALQQQVAILQAQLMQARAQLACGLQSSSPASNHHSQWPDTAASALLRHQENPSFTALLPVELAASSGDVSTQQHWSSSTDGDLHYLAQAMARSSSYSLL